MKKVLYYLLTILLLSFLIVVGCTESAPTTPATTPPATTPPATTPPATTPPATSGPTIDVKYSTWAGAATQMSQTQDKPWMAEIEERSDGRVKFTYFSDSALGGPADHMELVETGACDIGMQAFSVLTGQFALTREFTLPGMWPSAEVGATVSWEAYEQGYLKDEFDPRVKLFAFQITAPQCLHWVQPDPPRNLEEMKGKKIYAPGGITGEAIEALGMVGNYLPPAEVYSALEKGMLEGARFSFEGVVNYKWVEVLGSHTMVTIDNSVFGWTGNLEFWNSLPKDIQDIFWDVMGGKAATEQATANCQAGDKDALYKAAAAGQLGTIYNPTLAEKAAMLAAIQPVIDKYLETEDANGLRATETFNFLKTRGEEVFTSGS